MAGQVARYLSEGSLSRPGILRLSTLRVDFGLCAGQDRAKIGIGSGQGGTLNASRAATLMPLAAPHERGSPGAQRVDLTAAVTRTMLRPGGCSARRRGAAYSPTVEPPRAEPGPSQHAARVETAAAASLGTMSAVQLRQSLFCRRLGRVPSPTAVEAARHTT